MAGARQACLGKVEEGRVKSKQGAAGMEGDAKVLVMMLACLCAK